MATSYRDYFDARITRELETGDSSYGASKYEELQRASQEKVASLQKMRLEQKRIDEANKQSLVGRLGLDRDGFVGEAVDIGAATAAGVGNYIGTVGNAAAILAGNDKAGQAFQEATNLDGLVSTNDDGTKVSGLHRRAADLGISALKGAIAVPEMAVGLASMVSGGAAGKYLEEAGFRPEEAKQFLDTLRTHEQQAASKNVNGAEGFWNTMGAIAENPSTVPQALMESLFPMLAGGLVGRGLMALGARGVSGAAGGVGPALPGTLARTVGEKSAASLAAGAGEGLTMAGSAAEQIRQQTDDGRLSFKQSLAAAGTGVMGMGVSRLSGGLANRVGLGDVDEAIVAGTLGTSNRGALTRTVGAGALEGGEEMAQSSGEQMLQNVALDKGITEGVGNAAAMGLVTGAAMGAPMGLAKSAEESVAKAATENEKQAAVVAAVESGDISALVDPTKPTFAPERAVAALVGFAQKPDTTPEQKQATLAQGAAVVDALNSERALLEKDLELSTPEGIQKQIATAEARLARPEMAPYADAINQTIESLKAELAAPAMSPKELAAFQKEKTAKIASIDAQLAKATQAMTVLEAVVVPPAQVDALIATATQDITQVTDPVELEKKQAESKNAAEQVFVLAMQSPNRLAPEAAAALANNLNNGLSEAQRNHLRVFAEARIEANKLRDVGDVSKEVYQGSDSNLGLINYRERIPKAIAAGRREQADSMLEKLFAFSVSHQGKADVVQKAAEMFAKTGQVVGVRKTNKGWEIGAPFANEKERATNGGLNISAGSSKLIAAIPQETLAINKTLDEMQSAYDLTFNAKGTSAPTATSTAPVVTPPPAAPVVPTTPVTGSKAPSKRPTATAAATTPVTPAVTGATDTDPVASLLNTDAIYSTWSNNPDGADRSTMVDQMGYVSKTYGGKVTAENREALKAEIKQQFKWFRSADDAQRESVLDALMVPAATATAPTSTSVSSVGIKIGETNGVPVYQVGTDPNSFTNTNAQTYRAEADRLGVTAEIEQLFAQGLTVNEVTQVIKDKITAVSKVEMPGWLSMVRSTLGIPSRADADGQKEFVIWKKDFDARQLNVAGTPQAASTPAPAASVAVAPEVSVAPSAVNTGPAEAPVEQANAGTASKEGNNPGPAAKARPVVTPTPVEGVKESSESNTVDEDLTESAEQTSEESSVEQSSTKGVLSVFADVSPEGTPYYLRNAIAEGFRQVAKQADDLTARPLATVKDFLSKYIANPDLIWDYVTEDGLTPQQQDAMNLFTEKFQEWKPVLEKFIPQKANPKEFRYMSPIRYLLNEQENGKQDLDENIKAAIAFAAFSWVAEEASGLPYLKKEGINALLGRKKETRVSKLAWETLGKAGSYEHIFAESLGGRVIDALGLVASADTPQDEMPKLRLALGAYAMALLEKEKLIQRTTVPGAVIRTLREEGLHEKALADYRANNYTVDTPHFFFAIARDAALKPVPAVAEIAQAVKGTKNILNQMFKIESGVKLPSMVVTDKVPTTASKTDMGVPGVMQEALRLNQSRERKVRVDTLSLIEELGDDLVHTMMGVTPVNEQVTHKVNRIPAESKNDSLIREYTLFKEFVSEYLAQTDDGLDTPIFMKFSVWKQQRVGIENTVANPQTSKFVRYLVSSPAWTSEIASDNEEAMESFFLRVAEGLKVKTEQTANASSVALVQEMLSKEVYAKAVAALRKSVHKEALTDADKKDIAAGVKAGKEKMHSLDVLIGVAYYEEAKANSNGQPFSFTVQMMGEVDGVANGTMLNHMFLGAALGTEESPSELPLQGGFYKQDDEFTHYNEYRGTPGNMDIYESTAKKIYAALNARLRGSRVVESIWAITGNIVDPNTDNATSDGRSLVKDALNPLAFGSSMKSIKDGMADSFIESVYAGFENLSAKKATQEEVNAYLNHLNTMIADKRYSFPTTSIEQLMETPLTSSQEWALRKAFQNTVGDVTAEVVEVEFAEFIDRKNGLNSTAQSTYGIFEALYEGMRQHHVEELIQKNEIPLNKKGERIGDLSKKQEKSFKQSMRNLLPVIHSVSSKRDKNLKNGMMMAKVRRKQNRDPSYATKVDFGTKLGNGKTSLANFGITKKLESPGVAMGSATTHSADSFISHMTQIERDVLNVHDAVGDGVLGLKDSARLMNMHTWQALMEYSPLAEAHASLERMVIGLANMVADSEISPQALQNVQEYLVAAAKDHETTAAKVLELMVTISKGNAAAADKKKYGFLGQLASVDQYAFNGGSYLVTDKDRAEALAKKEAVSAELSAELTAALKTLENIMDMKPGDVVVTPTANVLDEEVAETPDEDETPEGDVTPDGEVETSVDPLGEVGESVIESEPALVEFFAKNPNVYARRVIGGLRSMLSSNPELMAKSGFIFDLLEHIRDAIPSTLTMQLVTPKTLASEITVGKFQNDVRGWYVRSKTDEKIYVLSPEFKNSGLTVEMLTHEVVHAALFRTMQNKDDPEIISRVAQLTELMGEALAYATKNGLDKEFAAAFKDVDEFVAWGMTNAAFQEKVLTQFYKKPKTAVEKLKTGMKEFVDQLTDLLFTAFRENGKVPRKSMGQANVAMYTLIENVSALLAKAQAANQPAMDNTTVLGMASPAAKVQAYSTQTVLEALPGTSGLFQGHLRNVLAGIVDKLHGPYGVLKEAMEANRAGSPMDTWLKALDTGAAPFASKLLSAGLPISQQEAFVMEQVEVTVAAAIEDPSVTTRTAYRDLYRLYTEVAGKVKVSDFHGANPTQDGLTAAQATYDAIFSIDPTQGKRSDYLSRFVAFGLAHKEFNRILQVASNRDTRRIADGENFAERAQIIFDRILGFFSRMYTRTYEGQPVDSKLAALVDRLVDIEAKRKHTLAQEAKRSLDPTFIDKAVEGVGTKVRDGVSWAVNTDIVKNSRFNGVRLAGKVTNLVVENRMSQFVSNMAQLRDIQFAGKPGVLAGILNNMKGPKETIEHLVRMTKKTEKQRKTIMSNTAKFVRESFANNGKNLTTETKKAISTVFLRTGAHALLDRMSVADFGNLLGDEKATNQAIADVEKELDVFGSFGQYFREQANGLAYYKATGKANVPMLMMNAHNIAQMWGTAHAGKLQAADFAKAEKSIEQLVALYAIRYTSGADILLARELVRDESTRLDGNNGVAFTLEMHKHMQQEALERVFNNDKALMIHGYTPEIYNPHVEVVAASEEDGKELMYRGYEYVHALEQDAADPDSVNTGLYVLKDGGLNRYASGALSLTGLTSRGSTKHDGYLNVGNLYGSNNASTNAAIATNKHRAVSAMFTPRPVPDLSQSHRVFAAPVVNPQGDLVNWRYMMADKTKDTVLQRNNDFDQILGTLAGSTFDKQTSPEQNKEVLVALKEMFDAEYATQPHSYLEISAGAVDPELVEMWRMLSPATKQAAKEVFGENKIYVRKDSADAVFGYRKMSLADSFRRDPAARNAIEKAMVPAVEGMLALHYRVKGKSWDEAERYAKRAAYFVTKGERIWQELVHEVKDIIVVKTGTVLLGNIWSNMSMLYLKDVPLMDIARHHVTAFRGAIAYKKNSEQLEYLQSLLDTNQAGSYTGGMVQVRKEINRLKNELDRSPVKELMDAGLMPTIVEDIAENEDPYSYKSALTRKVEDWLPQRASLGAKAARQVYMAHDTAQYKALSQITQLSDFVARYTLYQYQTTRKKNSLSKQAAIFEASETFVNYDLPMQRNLQYLDDMGLVPFMKYFMNIQRVLHRILQENPARVLSLALMNNFLDLGPIVLSSAAITRIGNNPMQAGALKLPGSLDDLATVSVPLALLN